MATHADVAPPAYPDEEKQQEKGNGFEEGKDAYGDRGDPFGDETNAEVKYKSMSWWHAGMIMIAETISLGILSLPSTVATLGLVPSIILIVGLGSLATYTGFVLGQFKLRYPHIHNMADAGEVLMGRFGRELLGGAQVIFLIFIMGSHVLTFTVAMNALTDHGTCSIVFGIVGMIISFLGNVPRTLLKVSWLSTASFISIFAAVFITMVGIGVQHPGHFVDATRVTNLYKGFGATSNIIFAYAGHVAFFGFMSEMKKPQDYPKALFLLQGTNTSLYAISAAVIYRYGGRDVTSPALGSTGPVLQKVAYGVALPTIIIAGVINGHVACKYVYVRVYRGTDFMSQRTWKSIGVWVGLAFVGWLIGWIIAEAIPVFNNLLSLIVALFASWFTYGLSGVFWLYMNKGLYTSSPRKMFLTVLNFLIFLIGATICGLGLYSSGKAIHDNPSSASFSCADNSES